MRRALAVALGLGLLALGACGGDGSSGPAGTGPAPTQARRLNTGEQQLVARSNRIVERYCAKLALSVTGQRRRPSAEEQARAFAATDRLIELVREKPAARLETGEGLALFLGDLTEDLEGSNCDPRLVQRLDQALAALPQQ
jgi:hypothetical protein